MPFLAGIRTLLDDSTRQFWRGNNLMLQVDANRAFLAVMPGDPAHKLRMVRSVLRASIVAKQVGQGIIHVSLLGLVTNVHRAGLSAKALSWSDGEHSANLCVLS
jgi:hypothetical protein